MSFLWISSCLFFVSLGRGLWNLFVVVTVLAEFSWVVLTVLSGFFFGCLTFFLCWSIRGEIIGLEICRRFTSGLFLKSLILATGINFCCRRIFSNNKGNVIKMIFTPAI